MEQDGETGDPDSRYRSERIPLRLLFFTAAVCLAASVYAGFSIISRNAAASSPASPGGALIVAGEGASTGMVVFAIITLLLAISLGLWGFEIRRRKSSAGETDARRQ